MGQNFLQLITLSGNGNIWGAILSSDQPLNIKHFGENKKQQKILTRRIIAIASNDKNLGYRTSSFTIESNTSSSSSPGNGD